MKEHLNILFIKETSDKISRLGIETWNNKRITMKEENIDELYSKNRELIEEEKETLELNRINIDLIIQNK